MLMIDPRSLTENAVTAAFRAVFGWCPVRDGAPPDATIRGGDGRIRRAHPNGVSSPLPHRWVTPCPLDHVNPKTRHRWTDEDMEFVRNMRKQGVSFKEISKAMPFNTNVRSVQAALYRASLSASPGETS